MTTAPEAKKRIVAALAARPALAAVPVTYGQPTRQAQIPQTEDRAIIFMGPVEDATTGWGELGHKRRREDYTITLTVDLFLTGDDEAAAETRAAQLLAEAQDALTADPQLNGLLREGVEFESGSLTDEPSEQPEGWRVVASCRVRCVADVTAT